MVQWLFLGFFWLLQLQEIPGLAERMGSLMCVDTDLEGKAGEEEEDTENYEQLSVHQALESEIRSAADKGYDSLRWLELEGLGIDDDTFLSLHFPSKFQVRLYIFPQKEYAWEFVKNTKLLTANFGRICWRWVFSGTSLRVRMWLYKRLQSLRISRLCGWMTILFFTKGDCEVRKGIR